MTIKNYLSIPKTKIIWYNKYNDKRYKEGSKIMTSDKLPNINELSARADKIYQAIPAQELKDRQGQFVAIELDSGECFFDDTKDEAVAKAKAKYVGKIVFVRRVGAVERIQSFQRYNNLIKHNAFGLNASVLR